MFRLVRDGKAIDPSEYGGPNQYPEDVVQWKRRRDSTRTATALGGGSWLSDNCDAAPVQEAFLTG
jgi:hypothetical protein